MTQEQLDTLKECIAQFDTSILPSLRVHVSWGGLGQALRAITMMRDILNSTTIDNSAAELAALRASADEHGYAKVT